MRSVGHSRRGSLEHLVAQSVTGNRINRRHVSRVFLERIRFSYDTQCGREVRRKLIT